MTHISELLLHEIAQMQLVVQARLDTQARLVAKLSESTRLDALAYVPQLESDLHQITQCHQHIDLMCDAVIHR